MKKTKEAFDEMHEKLGGSEAVRHALEVYTVFLLEEQKRICADAYKLCNMREIDGQIYIKVSDAQNDVIGARLPINFSTIMK